MVSKFKVGTVIASVLFVCSSVSAELVKYNYTGNLFPSPETTGVSQLTGYFIIDSADMISLNDGTINPIEYSFTDGLTTYGDGGLTPTSEEFYRFVTDATGNIIDWDIFLANDPSPIEPGNSFFRTAYLGTTTGLEQDLGNYRAVGGGYEINLLNGLRGEWTVSAVPVPATVWLFGSGLIGLIGIARRKKR